MSGTSKLWMALLTVVVWALAASAAHAQTTIKAADASWQPSEVTVPTGTTVRWEFDQTTVPHTVTSTSTNWNKNESREPGGPAVTETFNTPGTYTFRCNLHGGMTGTVTVTGEPPSVLVFSKTTGFRHTESIAAGIVAIEQMGEDLGYEVDATEDATRFTDSGLRPYDVVVFLNTDGEGILNAAQRTAFERWTQRGGGSVGIHADANADRDWAWKTEMRGGSLFLNHPAGNLQFQTATVNRVDDDHPSTRDVPENWVREDEWYNFTAEPQDVHVLLKLDESTYDEQDGSTAADDHPIAWCSRYDGGRQFYTALGHHGAYWSEPDFLDHIRGAIQWATGTVPGECGPDRPGLPTDASFDKVTLDDTTENPMEIAVASDGDVYYVELAGKVKHYDRQTGAIRTLATIPVHRGNENGLLGITLDPAFDTNHHLYLFYSRVSPEVQRIARFTVSGNTLTDERPLLEFPHQRIICCHSSGSMTFGPDGNLYISTGDDSQHAESQGYNPIDDRLANEPGDNPDADHARDARRSSGNTNDLRGKILRIKPLADPSGAPGVGNTYTIPGGNLFGLGGKYPGVDGQTRPEIYTMGHRNPFRIQVDSETGWLYNGEVGPDAGGENANRGPRGYDELNQIREAGNMGWPYCIADNKAYSNWDFGTQTQSGFFNCSGAGGVNDGPLNDSAWNTGKPNTPPTTGALLWWPYQPHANAPNFPWNTPPLAIPEGPGRTAIAGPIYHFNSANPNDTKFPVWFDDKVFFADWSRDWIATLELNVDGSPKAITEFMPNADFRHPQDIEMGANGSLYVLEWGRYFNYAGSGINPDSGLYRIDYAKGTRTPVARATADKDSGPAPLTVQFSSAGSEDADGDELTFSWDFGDGQTSTEPNPTHTFTNAGTYNVRLTATDSTNKSGTSTVVINAGNTRPAVNLTVPVQGGIFDWGDEIPYTVTVTDPEDGTIDCNQVTVNVGVFHDEGGNAHVHPGTDRTGCSGAIEAPADSGHEKSANIALVLIANYTDKGGAPGSAPLTGASTRRLTPKTIQAEHYTGHTGTQTNTVANAEGGRTVGYTDAGEYIYFEPVALANIDQLRIRYAAGEDGGFVDVREGALDGDVIGTASLPPTASWTDFQNVTIPLDPEGTSGRLYFTFRAMDSTNPTDLFDLDEFTFVGKGIASNSTPTVSATADKVAGPAPLAVSFTGTGADADGDTLSYAWDFTNDGTTDATTANASYTYAQPGQYTAKFTVSDGERSRSVEIDIEAYPPLASCPGNDQFDGTTLYASRWSVVRRDDDFLSVNGGTLNLNAQPGEDIHGGNSDTQRNIVLQDLPDSGPWTATARVAWNPTVNFQNAGLLIYTDDNNWIKTGMVWNGSRTFEAFKELNDTPSGLGSAAAGAGFPTTFYVRFTSDGTTVRAQRSPDGQTWTNTGNATNLNGLTNPKVGMYATASTAAGTQPITASFDYFTLDAPQEPSDEFDGTSLNLCRWSQIVRHEPGGYTVGGGNLTLPAAHGDFFANAPNNNPNILLQPAPSGPWTMTTRLTFDPNENFEQAGLLVYGDDANYVKADYVYANGRGLEFLRESNNTAAGFGGFVGIATQPTTVDMRITSDGTTLRAYYRFAGGIWTKYGEDAALASVPNPKIGIYANDSNATVTSRDDAVFDFFRIQAGLPDTTAPTTTHTLAPPAPANGWHNGNVTLTLATEAGATTEYKLGGGAFQAYTGPVTLSDEGTTVVTYRSTDADGNVEADKTVTVKIDKTVPTSTATPPGGTFTAPTSVTLAGADSGSGLDKLEYRLDNGDWTTYTAPVTISGNGPHTLEHRATDVAGNVGAVGSGTYTIQSTGAPVIEAFADPTSGSAPLDVHFSVDGIDPDGGPALRYRWTIAGGAVVGSSFDWTFTTAGEHKVTVTATDDEGSTATKELTVTVTAPGGAAPTVDAAADKQSGPAPLTVAFTATGSDDGPAGELQYHWDFGDGNGTSRDQNPTHQYLTKGTYTATVTVTDGGGRTGTDTVAITVTDPPGNVAPIIDDVAVAPATGNAPLQVLFSSYARDPDGDQLTYLWEFGDGDTSTQEEKVSHVYRQGGSYTAKLTVSDGEDSASATVPVTVGNPPANQPPTVQIAADPVNGSAPLDVRFTASGRDPEGGALMYTWDYGDGAGGAGRSVTHRYLTAGTYTAKVTVRDAQGATGTATIQVTVGPAVQGGVRGAQAELAVPSSVRAFRARGLKVTLSCEASGTGRASLKVTAKAAKRLKLRSRTVAARRVSCVAGKQVSLRLKPSRATARRLKRTRTLRLALSVSVKGAGVVQRKVTIR
jgi:cytochrome c